MPVYHGWRDACTGVTSVVADWEPLKHLLDHSPGTFDWGDRGPGSADLALAILAHHLGEVEAVLHHLSHTDDVPPSSWLYHHAFKREVIANLDRSYWTLEDDTVTQWILVQWVRDDLRDQLRAFIKRRLFS